MDQAIAVSRRNSARGSHWRGFTLVELLVVIGIIALLISILLPSLSAARRQAVALKCEASLREIGNAALMYAGENKQFFPPAKLVASIPYSIDGFNYPDSAGNQAYWQSFLAKYVTKTKQGTSAVTNDQSDLAHKSVFWGCPAWDGYNSNTIGGINRVQTGLAWNGWPSYEPSYPALGIDYPPSNEVFVTQWPLDPTQGTWYKQGKFTHPSQRALCGDGLFWLLEALATFPSGLIPGQNASYNTQTYTASGQTLFDFYRHGVYPPNLGTTFRSDGGKVAFNILYADGHVSTAIDRRDGYRAIRQRFPG